MNVLVICSVIRTCAGVRPGLTSSTTAAAPEATAVAMLVPLRRKSADWPCPAVCRSGYVRAR